MARVTNGGANIWYGTLGDGPPVVMVYGIGGNSRRWWEDFPASLAERYRLVMLDNRGTGRSDHPNEPWTMDDMVGDVLAVADAAGLETFHLLGCSLGSIIARHFAGRHGRRLRSLSLLCPPNGISASEEDMRTALFWDPQKPLIESARASWPIIHPGDWADANDELLAREFETSMQEPTPARTFQFQLQAAQAAGDPNPMLLEYDWPVLIMHGTVDRLVPPENARTLKDAVPRAKLVMLEGASHNFWQHDPARSAREQLAFLDAAEAAGVAK